jgi:hypothetical protein
MTVNMTGVQARLHSGQGGNYLWVVNPKREASTVNVTMDSGRMKAVKLATELWQKGVAPPKAAGTTVEVIVADRNVSVLKLE